MKLLLDILYDPRFFAFLSMAITAGSVIRFAFARKWWEAVYWLAAFILTFVVTFRPVK